MGRFDSTKAAIDANIKKNDNQEITGSILNYVMNNMVDATESQLETTDARINMVSDALADASSEIDALATEVESQNEMIEDLQNTKIDKEADDYYPQLSVGLADNLVGEDVVDSEISFRRSGGGAISDGTARIEAIKGNSVVWNQKLDINATHGNRAILNYDDKIITATMLQTAVDENFGGIGYVLKTPWIIGHKYLLTFDDLQFSENITNITIGNTFTSPQNHLLRNGIVSKSLLLTSTLNASLGATYINAVGELSVGDSFSIKNLRCHDLTQMFGSGNEPTTIGEFYARKPLGIDENAYNEGEVIHMDAQSLESVGVNQWDEEWELGRYNPSSGQPTAEVGIRNKNKIRIIGGQKYYCNWQGNAFALFYDSQDNLIQKVSANGLNNYLSIANREFVAPINAANMIFYAVDITTYNHDICINLSDASIDGKYFPYIKRIQALDIIRKYFPEGMKSARAAHEEIRYNKATQKWEKVQRIGSVDMGSLNWYTENTIQEGATRFLSGIVAGAKEGTTSGNTANILCAKYPSVSASATYNQNIGVALKINGDISIYDPSYENSISFKAAMQGVILYYELAEPIVTELEDDFNLDYEVWNGGTEKILSDVPTTPLKADIAYGFNAVGKIKELEEKINSGSGGVSKDYVDGKLTELSAEVGKKVDANFVNNAIAAAIGDAIDGGY